MNHQAIELSNSFSDVILAAKGNCKKIIFDLNLLKNPDKIRRVYRIPAEEPIIAFCKSPVSLFSMTTEGLIFTNQALYFFPEHTLKSGPKLNRILYTAMDSYLFTQDGKNGVVHAQTLVDKIRIMGPGPLMASYNIAGTEIRQLLRDVQNHLFKQNPLSKCHFDSLAATFFTKVRSEMGISEISTHADAILYGLMKFPDYADAAAMLKAEYLFREFLPEKYEKFATTLPRRVSNETKAQIINIPASFTNNYISTLTDLNVDYKYKDLSKIYERQYRRKWKDVDIMTIWAYLSIRMHEADKFAEVIPFIRKEQGNEAANKIEFFRGIYGYHMMQKTYSAIVNKEEFHPAYSRFRDGVGLTPLHYAILLKNEATIMDMLKKAHWTTASPCKADESFAKLFNYLVPAFGKQLPYYDKILLGTNKTLINLKKNISLGTNELKVLNVISKIQNVSMSVQEAAYKQQRRNHTDEEKLRALVQSMLALGEGMENLCELGGNIADGIEEAIEEFTYIVEESITEALEVLKNSTNSTDPLVRYLYRLYFEPGFFQQVLFATKNNQTVHLYEHKGFYFVAPEFAEINLPPLEVQSSQKKTTEKTEQKKKEVPRNTPIYRNSWFSPKAHRDADVLKSEYRKLAKQYHPDVSNLEDSTRLFQDISTEYKELLEKLSAKS